MVLRNRNGPARPSFRDPFVWSVGFREPGRCVTSNRKLDGWLDEIEDCTSTYMFSHVIPSVLRPGPKPPTKMRTAQGVVLLVFISNAYGFISTPPSLCGERLTGCRDNRLSLRMSAIGREQKTLARDFISTATSAVLIAGLMLPIGAGAGNNYPPIDTKDTTRCEVNGKGAVFGNSKSANHDFLFSWQQFKSSAMGQANAARDKLYDLRECPMSGKDATGVDIAGMRKQISGLHNSILTHAPAQALSWQRAISPRSNSRMQ